MQNSGHVTLENITLTQDKRSILGFALAILIPVLSTGALWLRSKQQRLKQKSAAMIQADYRKMSQVRLFTSYRCAIISIQKTIRGMRGRRIAIKKFKTLSAIIKLQYLFRCHRKFKPTITAIQALPADYAGEAKNKENIKPLEYRSNMQKKDDEISCTSSVVDGSIYVPDFESVVSESGSSLGDERERSTCASVG